MGSQGWQRERQSQLREQKHGFNQMLIMKSQTPLSDAVLRNVLQHTRLPLDGRSSGLRPSKPSRE